ncbi:putative c2h2 transcription factor protein [Botrytis fragariae]|uniref:Putative c2h2 transcription factor protein n=1 Tax=Botrytis fragariae TaxID=1964551 RepID=A0A8H6B028_9HELO|nr:putative c2h2 transcription factor protein [Botrytis fragariae]KAF5876637.1 putative c2h2 transcription factor protein [Botrytis fragariae]
MGDLDIKFLLQQKKAEKLKALEAARTTVPPAWDAKYITTKEGHDGEFESNANFDSDNETSANTASPQQLFGFNYEPQSLSSTNPKPLRKDELSKSSTILTSIEPDKRRFFRPLADAITSSSGDQLGKILLRLCVEYPDARAVVESLLADTIDDIFIENPHPLLRISSNSRIEQSSQKISPIKKALENPLLPIALNNKNQKEEQRPLIAKSARDDPKSPPAVLAIVKPIRKLPSVPQPPISPCNSVVSEKRKREELADALIVSPPQKKSKPYFVIPKHSKKDIPLYENKDTIPQSKLLSSNSLSTSERFKPPKSIEALQPLSDFGNKMDVGGEQSDKYTCSVCHQEFGMKKSLERHLRGVHKTEGEPFGCSICTKKYALRDYLYRHLTSFHTTGSKCNACGLSYPDGDILSTHMRSVHGVQAVEDKKAKEPSTALNPAKKQVRFQEDSMKERKS